MAAQQRPDERPDMDVWAGGISSGMCYICTQYIQESKSQTQKNRLKVGLCISLCRHQRDGTSGRTRTATLIQQRILKRSCI